MSRIALCPASPAIPARRRSGWTGLWRRLFAAGGRPARLDPDGLSDHLLRDLGLADGRSSAAREPRRF